MDLRSEEKEKRTLHWFVNGRQQNGFIKGVPDRVEFVVCYRSRFLFDICFFLLLNNLLQICTYSQNDSVEFVRLEELLSPSVVRATKLDVGLEW